MLSVAPVMNTLNQSKAIEILFLIVGAQMPFAVHAESLRFSFIPSDATNTSFVSDFGKKQSPVELRSRLDESDFQFYVDGKEVTPNKSFPKAKTDTLIFGESVFHKFANHGYFCLSRSLPENNRYLKYVNQITLIYRFNKSWLSLDFRTRSSCATALNYADGKLRLNHQEYTSYGKVKSSKSIELSTN